MTKRPDRTITALDERTQVSIVLALTGSGGDADLVRRQDAEARRLGLTGAEIDMARAGRSFEARTSHALALALAACGPDEALRTAQRDRAARAGIPTALCDAIEAFVRGHPSAARSSRD
jgi:hypothetical protein